MAWVLPTTPNNCRNAHGCARASRLLSTPSPSCSAPAGERRVVPGEAPEPGKPRKSRSRRSSRSEAAGPTGELGESRRPRPDLRDDSRRARRTSFESPCGGRTTCSSSTSCSGTFGSRRTHRHGSCGGIRDPRFRRCRVSTPELRRGGVSRSLGLDLPGRHDSHRTPARLSTGRTCSHGRSQPSRLRDAGRSTCAAVHAARRARGLPHLADEARRQRRTRPRRRAGPPVAHRRDRSAGWAAARAALTEALGAGFERPLDRAPRRVGELAASELARGRTRGLDKRLADAMGAELDGLAEKLPQLREGQGRDLALAALALGATHALAKSRRRFDLDPALLGRPADLPDPVRSSRAVAQRDGARAPVPPRALAARSGALAAPRRAGRTTGRYRALAHPAFARAATRPGPDLTSKVRAIWSPDYPLQADAIYALRRSAEAVPDEPRSARTTDAREADGRVRRVDRRRRRRPYTPRAGVANRLALSALGGLLDVQGSGTRPGRRRPRAVAPSRRARARPLRARR